MAVDFGILERTPTIGARFMEGQQAAQQQAERNMLRQMQMQQMAIQQENMLAQREERLAQSEQRRAATAEALARRQRLAAIGKNLGDGALTEEGIRQALQQAVIHGDPKIVETVMKIRDDFNAERDYARVYGGAPTPAPAGAAPATVPTGAPAVEAGGEAPVNAMLAQAAPAVEPTPTAAPAAAAVPTAAPGAPRAIEYAGYTYTPAQLDVMRRSRDPKLREVYNKIAAAEAARQLKQMELDRPSTDQAMMTKLGIPLTPEGFARYKSLGQQPAADIQGYKQAKSEGYAGSYEDWVRMKAREGAARVSNINKINAFEPASEQAQKDYIKGVADERKQLRSATDTLSNLAAAKKLIPSASAFMGPAGESLQKTASFLNERLGFAISTEGVRDAEVLRTRLFQGVLDNLKRLDSQPSQEQQRVLQQAFGTLGTSPDALPLILDRIEESIRNRVDAYNVDVSDAEQRGVKFPFKPQIKLPPPAPPLEIPRQTPPPSRAAPAAAAPAPARTLTPQDRQALEWANKNASDPRAAEIKRRLGQ